MNRRADRRYGHSWAGHPIPQEITHAAGRRIGPFLVEAPIGEGGMGVVFRAHDTKLQRDVALKVLPDHFADDPERLSRFQREAQVLASLNSYAHSRLRCGTEWREATL